METFLGVEVQPTVVKEPVMDVPAVDMTASVVAPKVVLTPARIKRAERSVSNPREQHSHAAQVEARARGARDGSVGRDTFERVDALLRQGTNKTEAFKQVADETGKNSGTVAANYYRAARAGGVVKPPKRRATAATAMRGRQKATQNVGRRGRASSDNGFDGVDQIIEQLVASVVALTGVAKAQDAEVRELRRRVDGVRTLLG